MKIRIYYEDTDCGGVVYYANYLKYFERARTQYLEERGLSVASLLKQGTQFMVTRAQLEYRSPARYGDTLSIETRVTEQGKASVTFAHVIRELASGRVVVEGAATLAATDLSGKIKRLPAELVQALEVRKAQRTRSRLLNASRPAARTAPQLERRHG